MKINQILNEDTTLTGRITLSKLKSKKLQTGLVNVDGGVSLYCKSLITLPVKFGDVTGDFDCRNNYLETLEGAPQHVNGDFLCGQNYLTSLEYSPITVSGDFNCYGNTLQTLNGATQTVKGNFHCGANPVLTTLEGSPKVIGGNYGCSGIRLLNLVGVNKHIKEVNGYFDFQGTSIKHGGLGLLLIKGLQHIHDGIGNAPSYSAFEIIDKYLLFSKKSSVKGVKALYICEDELIQAGLEEFAQI